MYGQGTLRQKNSMKNGDENKEKNDGIHTVTERKLSQSQVNKVLKYGVYAKAVELLCFKPAFNNNGTFSIEIAK